MHRKSETMLRRLLFLFALLALSGPTWAQREPMPLHDFIDMPVPAPTTPARVKAAIVKASLAATWGITEQADGSLVAIRTRGGFALPAHWLKVSNYGLKVKFTYDANKFSASYLDSHQLKFRTDAETKAGFDEWQRDKAAAYQQARYKDWPETPYAVRTTNTIDINYEDDLRRLLDNVRRYLIAPAP
jgi:hypothetical protein